MANNKIQVKRTSTSGRTPNTTNSGNAQYITAGELALNMSDGILYSSNGSALIEIGANNTDQFISNSITISQNKPLRFQTVNTSAFASFRQQNDDNFVLYTTNTAYNERPVFSIYANSTTSNLQIHTGLQPLSGIIANGSIGSAGQTLASNGTGLYWAAGAGTGTVTQVDSGNGLVGGPITSTGTLSVKANTGIIANTNGLFVDSSYIATINANNASYLGGVAAADYQTEAGLSANVATLTSNNATYAFGKTEGNLNVNNALTANNSSYLNSKTESNLNVNNALTANNSSYLGGTAAASFVQNTDSRTLSGNLTFTANVTLNGLIANGAIGTAGHVLHSDGSKVYWAADDQGVTSVATGNGMTGGTITTTGTVSVLANTGIIANSTGVFVNSSYIGTLTANAAGYLNGKTEGNLNVNNALTANNSSYLNSKTEGNLNVNNALTANNSSYLGGTAAASYVQNTDSRTLSGNLVFSGANTTFSNKVTINGALNANDVTIAGNLVVSGTVTTVNTATLDVKDVNITVAKGAANSLLADGGGITVDGASATWNYNDATASWVSNIPIRIGTSTTNVSINTTAFSGTSNNSTYAFGKTEVNLNVNNALTANAATYLNGKTEGNLNVNNALTANASTYLNGKTESNLNVNNALTANNASYLGGVLAASYVQNTDSRTLSGNVTFTANVTLNGLIANGGIGTAGQVLHSDGTKVYWAADDNSGGTVTSITMGNGLSSTQSPLTTSGTMSVVAGTGGGLVSNSTGVFVTAGTGTVVNATGVHVNSTYIGTLSANNTTYVNGKTEGNLNVNNALTANNASYLGGVLAASYVQNTDSRTLSGNLTFSANVTLNGLIANGAIGTAGHVLHSDGAKVYWAADDQGVTSVATGNGLTGGTITATGTLSVLANTGIVANATGVHLATAGAGAASYSSGISAITVDAYGRVTSVSGSAGYVTSSGVTSVSGTGTVSGLTLTGTVTSTGSLTLGGTLSASVIDNMTDEHRLFNNMGDNHTTRTSFDATNPSYNFGWRFVQGSTNGPGVNSATQYYSEYVGLGNDYAATGAGSYGMQIAYPRNVTNPYIAIRYNENNTLGSWQKISAGYSDTSGTAITSNNATFAYGKAESALNVNAAATPAFSGDSVTKNDLTTRTESGFYETATGTTAEGWPLNDNSYQSIIAITHSNDTNYYSTQIGGSFFDSELYFRKTNGTGTTAWTKLMHVNNTLKVYYANSVQAFP